MNRSLRFNENCLVTQRKCQRYFEASKKCFVACPNRERVGLELGIIESKCKEYNIEPYIAVDHRVFGKDVFCEKICGQIIESKFCIVLLKHDKIENRFVPNANVYHEYGLMIGLQKKIIPVIEKDSPPSFNIQGIDTIIYTPENFEREIGSAIKLFALQSFKGEEAAESSVIPKDFILAMGLKDLMIIDIYASPDAKNLFSYGADLQFFLFENRKERRLCYVGIFMDNPRVEDILLDVKVLLKRIESGLVELDCRIKEIQSQAVKFVPQMLSGIPSFDYGHLRDKENAEKLKEILSNLELVVYAPENIDKKTLSERYSKIVTSFGLPRIEVLHPADIKKLITEEKKTF